MSVVQKTDSELQEKIRKVEDPEDIKLLSYFDYNVVQSQCSGKNTALSDC